MRILVVGDSHAGPLKRGWERLRAQGGLQAGVSITVQPVGAAHKLVLPFWQPAGDHARITNPRFRRRLSRIPPPGPRPDAIGLSMPFWSGRVVRQMGRQDLSLHGVGGPGRLVSNAVFRQMVLADQKEIMALADYLLSLDLRLFVVAPPGYFRDFSDLPRLGPLRLLGLNAAYRAVMRAELAQRAVPVVDVPEACFDRQGFMLSAFRNEDPADTHHGNADFGALMIGQIERWAAARALSKS